MSTVEACPDFSLGTLWYFFNAYYYIFGVLMILLGIFLLTFGGRFFKTTLFITGTITVAAAVLISIFVFIYPSSVPTWAVLLTMIVALGMGTGIGYASF